MTSKLGEVIVVGALTFLAVACGETKRAIPPCALLAGSGMGPSEGRSWRHIVALAAILAITVYVIIDLEYPRLGLFQVTEFDQLLVDVRASMR